MRIELTGIDDVEKQMQRIERGMRAMARYEATVYSRLPYAFGMHYGRHRVSGKLARKAGGTYYMSAAVQTVLHDADRDLSEGLKKVTAPGPWVLRRLGLWVRRLARANAPRQARGTKKSHNYRLYRSIKYRVGRQ